MFKVLVIKRLGWDLNVVLFRVVIRLIVIYFNSFCIRFCIGYEVVGVDGVRVCILKVFGFFEAMEVLT